MALSALAGPARAAIVIQGTRVVFPADSREVTLRINNPGTGPVLVQSWLDDGHADIPPEKVQVPFVLAPSVARVEPGKGTVLRISYTGEALPADRESLFWLNVLEVPPKQDSTENVLQFAFRSRIKVFFRPVGLTDVDAAPARLTWRLASVDRPDGKAGKQLAVEASNPTPYYVSFGFVEARLDGKSVLMPGGMVAPHATQAFVLPDVRPGSHAKASVRFEVINDYGGRSTEEKPLTD
ncbi:fimbrial biogenesis chaperone [Cupriavidus sp. 30B13]|uniref:fimbrial biogenesis chaperone n=1 Tax=Cupriavidus sp. 30B13 TaxID=3384241 RepID=UPI003B904D13